MGARKRRVVPAEVERLRRRFEGWRQTRGGRGRIPEPLWSAAVELAGRFGIHRMAKALRLDYYSLKRRVDQAATSEFAARRPSNAASRSPVVSSAALNKPSTPVSSGVTTFLELAPPVATVSECVVELKNADGVTMRVHLRSPQPPDLVALTQAFSGRRS